MSCQELQQIESPHFEVRCPTCSAQESGRVAWLTATDYKSCLIWNPHHSSLTPSPQSTNTPKPPFCLFSATLSSFRVQFDSFSWSEWASSNLFYITEPCWVSSCCCCNIFHITHLVDISTRAGSKKNRPFIIEAAGRFSCWWVIPFFFFFWVLWTFSTGWENSGPDTETHWWECLFGSGYPSHKPTHSLTLAGRLEHVFTHLAFFFLCFLFSQFQQ